LEDTSTENNNSGGGGEKRKSVGKKVLLGRATSNVATIPTNALRKKRGGSCLGPKSGKSRDKKKDEGHLEEVSGEKHKTFPFKRFSSGLRGGLLNRQKAR